MKKKLLLVSKSPRRAQLLQLAGFDFDVRATDADESILPEWTLEEVAEQLAKKKAVEAYNQFQLDNKTVLIAADTVVIFENIIFNKPADDEEALAMLETLSGKSHLVTTGVCIRCGDNEISFSDTAKVFFRRLEKEELLFYIRHHHPHDKAGSYGIQDWIGVRIVEKVEGDYFNVMGLPVRLVAEALKQFEITGMPLTEK